MRRKSVGEYPPDWDAIALEVKELAGWKCVRCGHPHAPAEGFTLTVHHLDLDPSNCRWWNLPALCQRCHLRIQAKVVMSRVWLFEHSDWFIPYAAGYYAFHAGLPDSRKFVEANAMALIGIGQGRILVESIELPITVVGSQQSVMEVSHVRTQTHSPAGSAAGA